jgi:hypothetical protein
LTQDLGRVPSRSELAAELAKAITHSNIVIDVPKIEPLPDYPLAIEDRNDSPEGPMIDAELLRRMTQGLDKRDRKILRRTLRGKCPAAIARKLGVSRERGGPLVNGVLWTLRADKPLASAFGAEAIDRPRGRKSNLPPIQTLGQARLAV